MSTIIREFILDHDDSVIQANVKYLLDELKDKKCRHVKKDGKVCGQQVKWCHIWPVASCRYRHESYAELLEAISKKQLEEEQK